MLTGIVDETKGANAHNDTVHFLMKLLVSSTVMLKNPHQIKLNQYQNDYNHILPYKNAALGALNELIDKASPQIIEETYPDILEAVFISVTAIPDILNLKIMKHPRAIARKIYKYILRDEQLYLENFRTAKSERVFNCILENLVNYSVEAHEIAAEFLHMLMNETSLNLHELLYGNTKWEEICDGTGQGKTQAKLALSDFSNWKEREKEFKKDRTFPVVNLVRTLLRVAHNVNEDSLKNNTNMLKMLHNCFATFEILISIKTKDKGKTYQAFQMLAIPKEETEDAIGLNETFKKIISVAQQVISINDKIYENFTKIIIEQQPAPNVAMQAAGARVNNIPNAGSQLPRAREPGPTGQAAPAPPNNQSFNINTNTFIDDE